MASANVSASMGNSKSQSTSQSSSTPVSVNSPQSDFELQLAQLLGNIGQGQYDWATNQFNTMNGVTDANINNYINNANAALSQSSDLWNQYANTFAPIMSQYGQEAQSWASPQMQNFNAGQAESTATQAADQAANNAKEHLMSFGVNPSSGMYGELEDAQQAARAASAASAGTQASLATKNTGQQMLLNAAQLGQQLPGQSVNAMNAAYQGIAGAENSILGNENTGVNLMDSANPYFNTAMSMKLPPVGNQSSSKSQSTGTQNSQSGSAGVNDGSNGGGGGGGPQYPLSASAPSGPNDPGANSGVSYQTGAPPSITQVDSGSGQNFTGNGSDGGGISDQSFTPDYNTTSTSDTSYDPSAAFGGGYADGGVIPTTGGHVPASASPSHGAQTDDIPARLNADEFVIPRDVVHWKGKEFFEKLIQQSRKARGAPQQPIGAQMKPPLQGRPTFRSRPMTAGGVI